MAFDGELRKMYCIGMQKYKPNGAGPRRSVRWRAV